MAPRTSKRKATSTPNTQSRASDLEEKGYYEILEISKGADETEIRKAYKKLAMKWHPDKNRENPEKATEMFKLVAEAFEVLSDPEKRDIYDKYGKDGVKNGVSSRNFNGFEFDFADAASIFEQFFGAHSDPFMSDPFFNRGGSARRGFGGHGNPFDMGMGGMGMGLNMGGMGMFSDFDDGFGSFGNFSSFSSSSFGGNMGGGGGMSKSTRTVTQVVNGKRVTKTETTVTYPDGHTETTSNESTQNVGRLGDGRGNSSNHRGSSGQSKSRLGWF